MAHKDPEDRRKYQRVYYRSRKWRKRRAAASARYNRKKILEYRALCRDRFEMDDYKCVYCGRQFEERDAFRYDSALTVDHLTPQRNSRNHSSRSKDDITTIRTSCRSCNSKRKSKPVCSSCYSLKLPWRHSSGALCCTDCGKLDTFPPDTPVREPTLIDDEEPDWIQETETDDGD